MLKSWLNRMFSRCAQGVRGESTPRLATQGFSLLEASFVLVLVGIMGGVLTKVLTVYSQAERVRVMQRKMERVVEAMGMHYEACKRLPFPIEGKTLAHGIVKGYVPYKELGLPESAIKDAWGQKMRYIAREDIVDSRGYFIDWPYLSEDAAKLYVCRAKQVLSPFPLGASVDEATEIKSGKEPSDQEVSSVAVMHCNWVAFVLYWGDDPLHKSELPCEEPLSHDAEIQKITRLIPAKTARKCVLDFGAVSDQTSDKKGGVPAWARMPRWETYSNFLGIYARGARTALSRLVATWHRDSFEENERTQPKKVADTADPLIHDNIEGMNQDSKNDTLQKFIKELEKIIYKENRKEIPPEQFESQVPSYDPSVEDWDQPEGYAPLA